MKNGAKTLEKCLGSIRDQSVEDVEIIVLDSMSTDNSREIAYQYSAKIIAIPDGTFNHGLTRNIGAKEALGEFVFYTVQDAWLSKNDVLEKMSNHFANTNVMGVVGHQAVPNEKDKNPMLWYKRFSEPEIVRREVIDVEEFKNATQQHQQSLIAWDDVVAMYRKSALLQQPFVATEYAEDWIWSRDALLKGWILIYDPSVAVYHYHHQSYNYAYKFAYAINYHFYKYFGFKPDVPALFTPMTKATYHLAKHKEIDFKEKLYWILYNYKNILGTYNACINFLFHKWVGGFTSIEKRYKKVCKVIPQGKQKV